MANVSVDGAIHFVCMDWRHMIELQSAGDNIYSELKNLVVWKKSNGGMESHLHGTDTIGRKSSPRKPAIMHGSLVEGCGPPSIPLSFILAIVLPSRDT